MQDLQPLRIGILQTDSVRDEFVERHGDYPAMFRSLLLGAHGLDDGRPLAFVDYDVRKGEYPAAIDDCDAYLITGSRDSVYDDLPWIRALEDFVRVLHERRHKLIGICFGHQLVAQALAGETRPADAGWAVGVHASRVLRTPPWMDAPVESFALLSSHKDQVTRLPAEAELFASNDFCPNAAYTIGDHILCVQGHPEFHADYSRALMELRRELLGEETFCRGMASLDERIDQGRVGRWILSFVDWRAAE
ncbi:MAG TPA: amidotransferase [Pseudomonadales bacterium]|nr:amidotransferase [Pseudomonadales bacterium]